MVFLSLFCPRPSQRSIVKSSQGLRSDDVQPDSETIFLEGSTSQVTDGVKLARTGYHSPNIFDNKDSKQTAQVCLSSDCSVEAKPSDLSPVFENSGPSEQCPWSCEYQFSRPSWGFDDLIAGSQSHISWDYQDSRPSLYSRNGLINDESGISGLQGSPVKRLPFIPHPITSIHVWIRQSPTSFPSPFCPRSPESNLMQSPKSDRRLQGSLQSSYVGFNRRLGLQSLSGYASSNNFNSSSPSPYPQYIQRKRQLGANSHRCISSVTGHHGHVLAIASTGQFLYSGSENKEILVSKKPLFFEYTRFGRGGGSVKALTVTDDKVYSAHQDNRIRVWCRHRGRQLGHKLVATLPTLGDYLLNFFPQKHYVRVRRHDKRLWIEHVDNITALALGPNGLLYSSSWDKTVKVWKLSNLRCIESIHAHDDAVNALATGTDGVLYTGSADSTVKVWAKLPFSNSHTLVQTLMIHKSPVNALALSNDGQLLYSGGMDCSIKVCKREDSTSFLCHVASLHGHRHAVLCLAVEGSLLCSGSADKTIRIWRKQSSVLHSCIAVLEGHTGPVKCLYASADTRAGCLIYSGSMDSTLKVWKVPIQDEDEDDMQHTHTHSLV